MRKILLALALTFGLLAAFVIHPPENVRAASRIQPLTLPAVAPGGSVSFPIPETQRPIFIAVSFSLQNGGTQTPSEVMYAVLNQDDKSNQFSWIGTNNEDSAKNWARFFRSKIQAYMHSYRAVTGIDLTMGDTMDAPFPAVPARRRSMYR